MRRYTSSLALAALVAGALAACTPASGPGSTPKESAQASAQASEPASSPTTPVKVATDFEGVPFSNLVDEAKRAEVASALRSAGISDDAVTRFLEQVQTFTAAVPQGSLVAAGTKELKAENTAYDVGAISEGLTAANTRLTNCRITSFTLAQQFINVANPHGEDSSQLFADLESIDRAPAIFDTAQRQSFTSLFGRIPTTKELDPQAHLKDIQDYFASQGITFADGPVSMVSVFMHDTIDAQAYMFVGHVGVLVETNSGLLFIEKLAFEDPYQAIWFSSRSQLSDYLMSKYDEGPGRDYSQPLILENNALIEGYRTVLK